MQTFEGVSSALDDIAGIMDSCRVYEMLYWSDGCKSAKAIIQHLPDLYAQCLRFIAKAVSYFTKDTLSELSMF